MIAEYVFKTGFELLHFWAEFVTPTDFGKNDGVSVNGQFIHCISDDVEKARVMIDEHYKSIGVSCKEIELVKPRTTKNSDLKYLSNPTQVLGYDGAVTAKTESAKKVLQLMDSEEDGGCRYQEFVRQVSNEDGISYEQLEAELDPFV
ncbi:MAG: hypothetical protein CL840_03370 [Crocinitomicaceae bacterium]|jgi:hypothetical protein|nr:hypothetical protein [Crocinitomicaceae bacterium]|tara:strand:+ start:349 stop:789 length:441 start_codon:yes stop_codon:yes gene_type:complete